MAGEAGDRRLEAGGERQKAKTGRIGSQPSGLRPPVSRFPDDCMRKSSLSSRNPMTGEQETVDQHEFGFSTVQRKFADDNVEIEGWLRYTYAAPFTVLLRSEEPDGSLRQSFFQAIQPIDERRTRLFFVVRVPETDPVALRELREVEEVVQHEDLWITAALRRTGMPVVGAPDLHVRSDANAIMYRRVMRRLLEGVDDSSDR